jgi:hypothetical protein
MEIEIRFQGMDRSPAFVEHATRRIEHYLGRVGRPASRVVLRVSEPKGKRGGASKRCHLAFTGPELGAVLVAEAQGDVHSALELALYRMRHALGQAAQGRASDEGRPRSAAAHLRLVPGLG